MSRVLVTIFFPAVLLTACNPAFRANGYTYGYNADGCYTGEHAFDNKISFCSALQDDQMNNSCAKEEREQRFATDCEGTMGLYTSNKGFIAKDDLIPVSPSFSYQFKEAGCDTGKQEFATRDELCAALADEKLNGLCAAQARGDYYQATCLNNGSN